MRAALLTGNMLAVGNVLGVEKKGGVSPSSGIVPRQATSHSQRDNMHLHPQSAAFSAEKRPFLRARVAIWCVIQKLTMCACAFVCGMQLQFLLAHVRACILCVCAQHTDNSFVLL
jgi:hypothetical protein